MTIANVSGLSGACRRPIKPIWGLSTWVPGPAGISLSAVASNACPSAGDAYDLTTRASTVGSHRFRVLGGSLRRSPVYPSSP
jgi:hypothetical protein